MLNLARTGLLLAGLTGLFLGIGYLLGGTGGMMIAFLFALGTNAFAYWNSDKMVLRMYGAHPAEPDSQLVRLVERLAENADIPMPKVYVLDNPQPNAFATGRDPQHASVCATTGLINMLSPQEIAGVLGHELGHVKHRDTLTMTVTATLAGAIAMLANFALFFGGGDRRTGFIGALALMILAPLAASLVQMAISRTREYEADRAGADVSGHPMWLASALEKIERGAARIQNTQAQANPATAHLFIINPLHGARGAGMAGLFSTHPPTAERIARLKAMAGEH